MIITIEVVVELEEIEVAEQTELAVAEEGGRDPLVSCTSNMGTMHSTAGTDLTLILFNPTSST